MKYEEKKPAELDALIKKCPLAYIAWGSHEWHGLQNPVGLDTLKAYAMAQELCKITGGVVLPPVYCGHWTMKMNGGFRHTFEFSRELVVQFVFEHLANMADQGIKLAVILMGHYGQRHVEAVKEGVRRFGEKNALPRVLAMADYEPAASVGVKAGDHGGKHETSLMKHFRPDLVDISLLGKGELVKEKDGISVDAREASAEHGQYLLKIFLEQAAPKIKLMLQEAMKSA
jgi:creatinine amidohydrolase